MLGQVYLLAQCMAAMEVMGIESLRKCDGYLGMEVKSQEGCLWMALVTLFRFTIFIQQYLLLNNTILLHPTTIVFNGSQNPIIVYHMHQNQQEYVCDQQASFQETSFTPSQMDAEELEYEAAMAQILPERVHISLGEQVLKHHRVIVTHNSNIQNIFDVYTKDCYIAIKKRQHFGTHCVYDVVLANFILQIHLLNLHRNSDEGDPSMDQAQLGAGGFGTVRKAKIGENILAVKRINFDRKPLGIDGFDIETENAERRQIQDAIREYCIYKICSLLRIGPQVIFSNNYDIVCFNNCIEFTMQLCSIPTKDPHFFEKRKLCLKQLQMNLLENMKILHSLHIVHTDIKPENIVYSQSLGKFVFTDFGLAHAIKEGYTQKTDTYFRGTEGYCSQEMRGLLSGEMGLVNLYVNDFVGLKKTVQYFQFSMKKSTILSHNAMLNCSLRVRPFEDEHDREGQWQVGPLLSTSPLGSDHIYIRNTHWLDAPYKSTSEINFYQSVILYNIFKENQTKLQQISSFTINRMIQRYSLGCNDDFVFTEVKKYVLSIFYPNQYACKLTLMIVDLKNTARCYGAKDEETLQKIDAIIGSKELYGDKETVEYFVKLKESIINDSEILSMYKFSKEMKIHLYLKNYNYFLGCCLRIFREAAWYKINNQQASIDLTFLCRLYIICNRLNIANATELTYLNKFFLKLWSEEELDGILQQVREEGFKESTMENGANNRIVNLLVRHAIRYMIGSERASSFDIIQAFLLYLSRFNSIGSDDYQFYYENLRIIESSKSHNEQYDNGLKVELVKVYRRICTLNKFKDANVEEANAKIKAIVNHFKDYSDKKYYFTCLSQLIMVYPPAEYKEGVQFGKKALQELMAYQCPQTEKRSALIEIKKAIGDMFLHLEEYQTGLEYLKQASSHIAQFYGVQNVGQSYYQCWNNISYAYLRLNQLDKAMQSYQYTLNIATENKVNTTVKSLIYRSILVIRLKMGISQQSYPEVSHLIQKIVQQTVSTLISQTTSDSQLKQYVLDMRVFNFVDSTQRLEDKIFVYKTLLKNIENYIDLFKFPYEKINYELNRIYVQLNKPTKGMRYIWNYISFKMKDFYNVKKEDYQLMNNFIYTLIKYQSASRALIIIRKYIFHIPLQYLEERKTAFKLFAKVHARLDHPLERLSNELAARDCSALLTRDFSKIYRKQWREQDDRLVNMMLSMWLKRV